MYIVVFPCKGKSLCVGKQPHTKLHNKVVDNIVDVRDTSVIEAQEAHMTDKVATFSQDMNGSMEPDEGGSWVRYEDVEDILSESKEQARLLGVSAECELSLLAKIGKLLKEIEEKTQALHEIAAYKRATSEGDIFYDAISELEHKEEIADSVLDKYNNT